MAPSATQLSAPEISEPKTKTEVSEPTPLEAISHGQALQGIPKFSSHEEARKHILIHMAAVFRDFARKGFTEGMSGHISVRDPEHETYIWMNPLGRHFGLLTAGDMICLDVHTGEVVGGNKSRPANRAGFLIHSQIHLARHDIHAICHAHTNAGRAWSVFGKNLDMYHQDICDLYDSIAVYSAYGGIVFAEEEGKNIAKALGAKNKAAILLNHGLLSVGQTVDEAGFLFGLLDRSCAMQLQIEAAKAGNPSLVAHTISDEEAAFNFKMASDPDALYCEMQPDLEYEIEMAGGIDVVARGVDKQVIF